MSYDGVQRTSAEDKNNNRNLLLNILLYEWVSSNIIRVAATAIDEGVFSTGRARATTVATDP